MSYICDIQLYNCGTYGKRQDNVQCIGHRHCTQGEYEPWMFCWRDAWNSKIRSDFQSMVSGQD